MNQPLARVRHRSLWFSLGVILAAVLACSSPINLIQNFSVSTPTPVATEPAIVEPAPSATANPPDQESPDEADAGWTRFQDDSFGLTFIYPSDWNGPEVNRFNGGIGVEVGSDTVYPFGTGLEDRNYTVTDAYFISISYIENTEGWEWDEFVENSPWIETYTGLLDLEDGESITTPRSLTIRQGLVQVGDFSGLEYIATLSETAQTEIVYAREIQMFDEDLNYIRVTGNPNNVEIRADEDWRAAYQRVDAEHNEIFNRLVESLAINQDN